MFLCTGRNPTAKSSGIFYTETVISARRKTMRFTSFLDGGRLTVALTGEIDHHSAKQYIQAIAAKIEELAGKRVNKLSGGQKQRVAIARAIVNNPGILLADEPTGNLDPDTSLEIMKVIEKINDLGTTVVMATHDRTMVEKMKKRVIYLESGKLIKDYEKGTYKNESN